MTRILTGLFAAGLMTSAAFAATPATATTHAATKPVDYAARCTSLGEQWKAAETSHGTNANFAKAKADAEKAAKMCASTKASDHKKGVTDYEAALKLLGITPT
jgi:hypothetical protein